jgi:hypothetical protein
MRLIEKLFIQGVTLTIILILFKAWLDSAEQSFMSYMPPLGFAFFMAINYFAQPIAIGILNIALINSLHQTKGWQVGFWLNGFFLLLTFLTINLILQTTFALQFLPTIAAIDLLLALPFGCIARFSNGGWKKPIE